MLRRLVGGGEVRSNWWGGGRGGMRSGLVGMMGGGMKVITEEDLVVWRVNKSRQGRVDRAFWCLEKKYIAWKYRLY